jgi:hypothetical protein
MRGTAASTERFRRSRCLVHARDSCKHGEIQAQQLPRLCACTDCLWHAQLACTPLLFHAKVRPATPPIAICAALSLPPAPLPTTQVVCTTRLHQAPAVDPPHILHRRLRLPGQGHGSAGSALSPANIEQARPELPGARLAAARLRLGRQRPGTPSWARARPASAGREPAPTHATESSQGYTPAGLGKMTMTAPPDA